MSGLIERLLEAADGFAACRDEENAFLTSEAAAALRAAEVRERELTFLLTDAVLTWDALCKHLGFIDINSPAFERARAAIPSRPSQPK